MTRGAISTALTGMGVLHLTPKGRRAMRAMIPPALRTTAIVSADTLVVLTGVAELAGAAGLLVRPTRRSAAGALAVYLAAVFPANAYAAARPERFGRLAVPLLPRAAAQVVMVAVIIAAAVAD